MAHIDATLRPFLPDINLSGVKVRVVPGHAAALYGEMTRNIMDVLRGASEPLSVMQIANAVVAKRGLAADDGDLIEALRKRVGSVLRTCKARGTAVSAHGQGLELIWRVAYGARRTARSLCGIGWHKERPARDAGRPKLPKVFLVRSPYARLRLNRKVKKVTIHATDVATPSQGAQDRTPSMGSNDMPYDVKRVSFEWKDERCTVVLFGTEDPAPQISVAFSFPIGTHSETDKKKINAVAIRRAAELLRQAAVELHELAENWPN